MPTDHSTIAHQQCLQQAIQALQQRLPRKARLIAAAAQLVLRGVTALDDGYQFADGAILRRPSYSCPAPSCAQYTTCAHEIAVQLLDLQPALAGAAIITEPAPPPKPPRRAARAPEATAPAPDPPLPTCGHCGQQLADVECLRVHLLAQHLQPESASEVRLAFIRGRHRLVLAQPEAVT